MIKNFNIFFLLESIFKMDPDFIKILQKLKDQSIVAKELLKLIDTDIKLNYNYIKSTDANDMVSFIGDSQVKRNIDQGIDPYTKRSGTVKIGRFIKQIFDFNGIKISDVDISKFVDLYKAAIDFNSNIKSGFKFVKEEDIRYWYNKNNYSRESGSLGSSCMRQSHKSIFFNIYVENPEVCQMLILTDDNNLLKGRALVWKLTSGDYYLDRIYTVNQSDEELFLNYYQEWLTKNHPSSKVLTHKKEDSNLRVKLKKWMFDQYPYVDSLFCLEVNVGILHDEESKKILGIKEKPAFDLSEQHGGYEQNCEYIEKCGKYIIYKNLIGINGKYYLKDDVKEVYYNSIRVSKKYVLNKDAVYSDVYSDYLYKPDTIESEFGLVLKGDIIPLYDMVDGEFKKIKDVVKTPTLKNEEYILLNDRIDDNLIRFITYTKNVVYNLSLGKIQLISKDMSEYVLLHEVSKYGLDSKITIHVYSKSFYIVDGIKYPIYSKTSSSIFLTDDELKLVEIKDEPDKVILKKKDYYYIFERYIYKDLVKFLEKNFPDSTKMKELLDGANIYLLENSRRYKVNNSLNLEDISVEEFFYKEFFKIAEKFANDYLNKNLTNSTHINSMYNYLRYTTLEYEPWKGMSDDEKIKDMISNPNRGVLIDTLIRLIFEELTDRNIFYYKNRSEISNYDSICYNICRYTIRDKYPYEMRVKDDFEDILLINDIEDVIDEVTADKFDEELKKRKTVK